MKSLRTPHFDWWTPHFRTRPGHLTHPFRSLRSFRWRDPTARRAPSLKLDQTRGMPRGILSSMKFQYPLVMTEFVAMDNGHRNHCPRPSKKLWFSIAMLNYQRVSYYSYLYFLFLATVDLGKPSTRGGPIVCQAASQPPQLGFVV